MVKNTLSEYRQTKKNSGDGVPKQSKNGYQSWACILNVDNNCPRGGGKWCGT